MKLDLIKANMIIVDIFDSPWPSQPHNPTAFHSLDPAGHTLFNRFNSSGREIPHCWGLEKLHPAGPEMERHLTSWKKPEALINARTEEALWNPDPVFPDIKPLWNESRGKKKNRRGGIRSCNLLAFTNRPKDDGLELNSHMSRLICNFNWDLSFQKCLLRSLPRRSPFVQPFPCKQRKLKIQPFVFLRELCHPCIRSLCVGGRVSHLCRPRR